MRKKVCGDGNRVANELFGKHQALPQYVSVVGLDWRKGDIASAYRDEVGVPVIAHKTGMDCTRFIRVHGRHGRTFLLESSFASGIADGDEFQDILTAASETASSIRVVSPRATPRRLEKAGYKKKGEKKEKGTDGFDAFVTLMHYEQHPEAFIDPKPRREATEEEKATRAAYLTEKATGWKESKKLVKKLPAPDKAPDHVRTTLTKDGKWSLATAQIAMVASVTKNVEHFDHVLGLYENAFKTPYRADMIRRTRWITTPAEAVYKSGKRKGQTHSGGAGLSLHEARKTLRRASRWVRSQVASCRGGKTESGNEPGKAQASL